MNVVIERFSFSETETEGRILSPVELFTLEQPMVIMPGFPAGVPYKSCIPCGDYSLIPYQRTNGQRVWCIVNESAGVYFRKADTSEPWHRFKCLFHPGNLVSHTQGCILPGVRRGWLSGHRAVLQSGFRPGYGMALLTEALGEMSTGHTLTINKVEHLL